VRNAIVRGDLRARSTSQKVLVIECFSLVLLALLTFLGLPPALDQAQTLHPSASLAVVLLGVQLVLVTYFASACALQEIAVEQERPAVDLAFGAFSRSAIVAGKSLASLVTILYWLVLGAPLLILAVGVQQTSLVGFGAASALAAVEAWGVAQVGLLYSIVIDSEFARAIAHWTTLMLAFVGTLALPSQLQWINPVIAVTQTAGSQYAWPAAILYSGVGLASAIVAQAGLRRYAA
jgi:ABC-type transport system involved in multi-copper enzyme maturation permease subunit